MHSLSGMRSLTEDRHLIHARLRWVQRGAVAAFSTLAFAFWFFQVVQHTKFQEEAESNHQRTVRLRAPRGMLFDRDGRVLVENRSSYSISLVPEHVNDLERTVRLLAEVAGLDEVEVREVMDRARRGKAFNHVEIVQDATLAQIAAVTARRLDTELPGVVVEEVPTRRYPTDALAAHVLGYVGEARASQIETSGFRQGAIVGQSGVELSYNALLMGEDGTRRVAVNNVGREIRTLEEAAPADGRRIQLTIDADLQRAAEEGFRESGYAGAAVFMDPRTGEVLAFTSLPAYDPNDFAGGIDLEAWTALNENELHPLQNRAIQGRYSPGSTFKLAVAVAALEEGLITPDFRVRCDGGAWHYNRYYRCHLAGGHGSVNLAEAIEHSCNTYFYQLGSMVGIDAIHEWATKLGLGVRSGIDLPNEVEGLVPSSEWKRRTLRERWYPGETISVAIGQGQVSVTPVSLAVMISTIANGGVRWAPRLVKAVDDGSGWMPWSAPPPRERVALKPETIEALHEGLWRVVNGAGTGRRGRIPGRDVAGKTGTAQVISNQGRQAALAAGTSRDLRDHGWFVFFAPEDDPQIAGVVFAEHAEHGPLAAPIAKHVLETYFAKQEGRPLPVWPAPAPLVPAVPVAAPGPEPSPVPELSARR